MRKSPYLALTLSLVSTFLLAESYTDNFDSKEWHKTDFSKKTIDLMEITSGGPPKDGIPAIDKPKFITVNKANQWLNNREPVIVVKIKDEVKAYPIQILMYHEIVNDKLANVPISVTFCPLCNAAIVFHRAVEGTVLDFGTTGRLRKSDLLMYDRQTESWWQQFVGEAVIGKYAGKQLLQLPSSLVSYQQFKKNYPQATVLSRDTGYSRPYGRNPYQGYDDIAQRPFLFSDPLDPRLPAMERVISIKIEEQIKVYPLTIVNQQQVIHDQIGKTQIVVFNGDSMASPLDQSKISTSRSIPTAKIFNSVLNGQHLHFQKKQSLFIDKETGTQWNIFGQAVTGPLQGKQLEVLDSGVHFAFAWLAFKPESEVYKLSK